MSQMITTRRVKVKGAETAGREATINAEDFDPELHEPIDGKPGRPRLQLKTDAVTIGPQSGTLDAAAVKELGEPKTKEQKDALDNAKVVKDPIPKKGGAPVAVGEGAPIEGRPHKPGKGDGEMKERLGGPATGLSPVGEEGAVAGGKLNPATGNATAPAESKSSSERPKLKE